jgi:hypothetical protein
MMRRACILVLMLTSLSSLVAGQATRPVAATQAAPQFRYVDVFVDAKAAALAAYQVEFAVEAGKASVVGIEGGEHPAFARTPPYYDPAAMGQNRVILAAFSTDEVLPHGRTRVARIHLMIEGDGAQYAMKLVTAADAAGKSIAGAGVTFSQGAKP